MEKAFTWTLCFDASELRNFNVNQKQSNGECLMGMFYVLLYYISRDDWCDTRCVFTYRREAFALLVSIDRAMRRPRSMKRATRVGFTLFLYINLSLGANDRVTHEEL